MHTTGHSSAFYYTVNTSCIYLSKHKGNNTPLLCNGTFPTSLQYYGTILCKFYLLSVLPTPRFTRTTWRVAVRLEKSLCALLKIGLLWVSLPAASFCGLFSWILANLGEFFSFKLEKSPENQSQWFLWLWMTTWSIGKWSTGCLLVQLVFPNFSAQSVVFGSISLKKHWPKLCAFRENFVGWRAVARLGA